MELRISCKIKPELDPGFIPAAIWNRNFRELADEKNGPSLLIGVERRDGTFSRYDTIILPHKKEYIDLNIKYVERIVKFLLWQKGGYKVLLSDKEITAIISEIYSPDGSRTWDNDFMGDKVYSKEFSVEYCPAEKFPESKETTSPLGRHLDGCRIGFDLGGSDRKCAAVIDGKVVFSEEIKWNPYFEKDPSYHYNGINASLKSAAEHLPRVDAIGGSAAGVYVNNEVRIASLFRGLAREDFDRTIKRIFFDLKKEWNDIPFEVVNDGEVTALAASMSFNDNAILGLSMGTSFAAGYVTPEGNITPWLNELAFAPVDYRENGPIDEWSQDKGCGVQFFSQQAVARLAPLAGLEFDENMPFPERLVEVQKLMADGDERARKIYETIGTCFGYSIAHYADFYEIRNLLILGRVTSGEGGEIIIQKAEEVLKEEFPELAENISIRTPNEKDKRHGQAIAAASLASIR
ncbi:MAG TPA: hypothetical protein QF753_06540 [Victivallales bacterium]|nr:hypothetical protein [Victivallales bacterium]